MNSWRTFYAALCCVGLFGASGPAHAFSISSGVTNGCHERIMVRAFKAFALDLPTDFVVVPESATWRELAVYMVDKAGLSEYSVSDAHRFLLVSLMIGIRSPDTDGHSAFDIASLRKLHSDPDDEGQYAHALRGLTDDGWEGNKAVLDGTRRVISQRMETANEMIRKAPSEQLTEGTIYLDFYGRVTVPVYGPMFYLGQAAHALQDSFAHTLRTIDYREILHFMNYVEAISSQHSEGRDGMAHSDSMDDCDTGGPDRTDSATEATVDLLIAARERFADKDPMAVEHVLNKWLVLYEDDACDIDNDYCNAPMLTHARKKQTAPYLEAFLGCQTARGFGANSTPLGALWLLFSMLLLLSLSRFVFVRE